MSDGNQRTRSAFYTTALSIAVILLLAALPSVFAGVEMRRAGILWFATLHQIAIASVVGALLWHITGKRRVLAIAIPVAIAFVWGPNLAGALEYSLTGENKAVLAIAERVGATTALNTLYPFLCDAFGYSFKIAEP